MHLNRLNVTFTEFVAQMNFHKIEFRALDGGVFVYKQQANTTRLSATRMIFLSSSLFCLQFGRKKEIYHFFFDTIYFLSSVSVCHFDNSQHI